MAISIFELQELCLYAGGKSEQEVNHFIDDGQDIDDFCYENFNVDFNEFCKISTALLKFTPRLKTQIGENLMNAFIRKDDIGWISIVQEEAEEPTT